MKIHRQFLVCIPIIALPLLLADLHYEQDKKPKGFHTESELAHFQMVLLDTFLPTDYNNLFAGSGVCRKCHGFDTLGHASVNALGEDINVVDDWRASMMANSAKDPFWRAQISLETLLHPQHKAAIEDKCTSCHAPMGHFDAKHIGFTHYSLDSLDAQPLAKDGVSCLACHLQTPEGSGQFFSGMLNYDTFKVAYGQYMSPLVSPMLTETGYKPKFSEHISKGGVCAGCHTLLTQTLDLQGNPTGNTFVEQATYHEWLNSFYKDELTCQGCHMPSLGKEQVFLVTGAQTEPRSPFLQHDFSGANAHMLKLLRNNIEALGLKATPAQFDEAILKTEFFLKHLTLELQIEPLERDPDTARFSVKLTNLAGHKFPSGYPSRRAFIEFLVKNEAGDTLFISGKQNETFEVFGQNSDYEPHFQVINSEEQVQIYELVMGDVNGNVTTVLERADEPIKDNRLPPKGFSTLHYAYDTVKIVGGAINDPDFNWENGTEGSGGDQVRYHIPLSGNVEKLLVSAKVFYQSMPPKWMKTLFDHSTPEIETFRSMFDAADRKPVLVGAATAESGEISAAHAPKGSQRIIQLFPVPSADGRIFVSSTRRHDVKIFDLSGRQVAVFRKKIGNYELNLEGSGVFLIQFSGQGGVVQVEKVVVSK